MRLLREFLFETGLGEWGSLVFVVDEYFVEITFRGDDPYTINEARKKGSIPLGGKYSARLDPPHVPSGQKHLHLFAKGNQLAAVNKDGSAHDRSHGIRIPDRVAGAIKTRFPHFEIPKNNMIETVSRAQYLDFQIALLNEDN